LDTIKCGIISKEMTEGTREEKKVDLFVEKQAIFSPV